MNVTAEGTDTDPLCLHRCSSRSPAVHTEAMQDPLQNDSSPTPNLHTDYGERKKRDQDPNEIKVDKILDQEWMHLFADSKARVKSSVQMEAA